MVQQQVDEAHLASMSQHCVEQAGGEAPSQGLLADGPRVVKVGLRTGLEQQTERFEMMVGSADVERTHHQGAKGSSTEEEPGTQLVVHVNIGIESRKIQEKLHGFMNAI